jgi:hypothetical protein
MVSNKVVIAMIMIAVVFLALSFIIDFYIPHEHKINSDESSLSGNPKADFNLVVNPLSVNSQNP